MTPSLVAGSSHAHGPGSSRGTATGAGSLLAPVAALDVLSLSLREADAVAHALVHELHDLGGFDVEIATHVSHSGSLPHHVVTVSVDGLTDHEVHDVLHSVGLGFDVSGVLVDELFDGPPELYDGIEAAVVEHEERTGGRVVVFPGDHLLVGTLTVGQALESSALDRIALITGAEADRETALVTRSFVRPLWERGELVLHTQPAVGGTLVPFETPFPTPCCADHA